MENKKGNVQIEKEKLYDTIRDTHKFLFPLILLIGFVGLMAWLMTEKSWWFSLLFIPMMYVIITYAHLKLQSNMRI